MDNFMNPLLNTIMDCSERKILKGQDDLRRKQNMRKYVKKIEGSLFTEHLKSVTNTANKVDGRKERIRCRYANNLLNPVKNIFEWNMLKKNHTEFEMAIDENISNMLKEEDRDLREK